MRLRFLAPGLCLVGALCFAAPANAADPTPDALFDQGIAHMEAGRYDQACPLIQQSYKLDPTPGTLFALAECEAKRGHLASAMARYDDYLTLYPKLSPEKRKKQADREQVSRAQIAALGASVPDIVLDVPQGAPAGVTATLDGVAVVLGKAVRVDPGEHVVAIQVPGEASSEIRASVDKGEHKRVVLPVKAAQPAAAPVVTAPQPSDQTAKPSDATPTNSRRTALYATAGVGVAGILVGGITGGLAASKKGTVNNNCGIGGVDAACNATGKAAADSLKTLGLISTIGFGVGLAGAAAAVVLFVTEPKAKDAAAARKGIRADIVISGRDGALFGIRGGF